MIINAANLPFNQMAAQSQVILLCGEQKAESTI